MKTQDNQATAPRIDKWLWAARFYKTRSKSKDAVLGGHIHVNGARVKAAHEVRVGDVLTLNRNHFKEEFVVQQLSTKRGSASVAQNLFEETPASIERRETAAIQHRLIHASRINSTTKPNKSDRRELIRLKNADTWSN